MLRRSPNHHQTNAIYPATENVIPFKLNEPNGRVLEPDSTLNMQSF